MEHSNSIKAITAALLHVQQGVGTVPKQSDNPYFHSKYANLETVLDAIKKPLNDAEIVFMQLPSESHDSKPALTTVFLHKPSGEWISSTCPMVIAKDDPQGYGSSMTYHRRYNLCAALGLKTDEDDDGQAGSPVTSPPKKQATPKQTPVNSRKLPQTAPKSTAAPAKSAPPAAKSGGGKFQQDKVQRQGLTSDLDYDWMDEKIGTGKFGNGTWREAMENRAPERDYNKELRKSIETGNLGGMDWLRNVAENGPNPKYKWTDELTGQCRNAVSLVETLLKMKEKEEGETFKDNLSDAVMNPKSYATVPEDTHDYGYTEDPDEDDIPF